MRKIILLIFVSAAAAAVVNAAGWQVSGIAGASYSETAVNNRWSGGETDARSWSVNGEGEAEKDFGKTNWLNSLKLEYGKTSIASAPEQESADTIYFNSIYKYKLSFYINPYVSFNADSQFTEFFDPAALTESAGVGWNILSGDKQNFKTRFGGALRQFMAAEEDTENETGAEWITDYSLKVSEYAKFVSEVKLFTSFDSSTALRWDSSLYIKLREYLSFQAGYLLVNSSVPGLYFSDTVETRLTLGLAFSYNLF
ncbi:MAG: DUF481 domain-containing protein [Elusimicrobiota bacterium]|nr:DUF481 domain-containing protein [Elusimicrobiota bacterium]